MRITSGKANFWVMLGLLALGFCISLYALLGASPQTVEWIINKTGYYFVAFSFLGFLYFVFCASRFERPRTAHLALLGAAVAIASSLLFMHSEFGPKIAMDDYTLSSTAKSLSEERQVEVLTQGRDFNGYFIRADSYVDKRPWLYPFMVSIVHDLTGFRLMNAYLINAVFGIILLSLTAMFGYRMGGLPLGLLGPFLWASLPLLSQNATGGGLDLLNVLLLFVVLLCGRHYLRRPDPERLSLLVLAMVLLSYTRYESLLFWLPVLGIIVVGWIRAKSIILSYAFSLAPICLIALAALIAHNFNTASFWEVPDQRTPNFSLGYIMPNLTGALYFFLNTGDELANSFLLGIAGIPLLGLFFISSIRSIRSRNSESFDKAVFLIWGLGVVGHFVFMMTFYHGQFDERITSRFSLPLYLLFLIGILVVIASHPRGRKFWLIVSTVMAVSFLGLTLPNKAKGIYNKRNFVVREVNWFEKQAEDLFESKSLVVDSLAIVWTLKEWHCINPSEAVSNRGRLRSEWERGKFPAIYLVERSSAVFEERTRIGFRPDYVYQGFEKELIAERSFSPLRMTRIYKVSAINVPERSNLKDNRRSHDLKLSPEAPESLRQ